MKLLLLILLLSIRVYAQTHSISGVVRDSETNDNLSSANIYLPKLNIGASTDNYGKFHVSGISDGEYNLKISYIGYETKMIILNIEADTILNIKLKRSDILLDHTIIEGTYPKFRETAVAFSELSQKDIAYRLGSKEAINILDGTPSAYISQQGGGIGEQRLNLRGFDQTNIAVMINGIPINNPENGEVYWSNWAGISELIQYVHVQRGLSAIPYSISSIGGSVNFVTSGAVLSEPKITLKTEIGSENIIKNSINFSTNISAHLTITGLFSRRLTDGYADQIYSDEYTYFISLGMLLNKHSLHINLFGSPQKHGQRLTPQSISDWSNFGKKYNADWGYLRGKPLNLRDNEFHNPTLNFKHNWQVADYLVWSNILSVSRGIGGGTVPPWYPELSRTEEGIINFDKEWNLNSNNVDLAYHPSLNRSVIALRKGIHKNYWGTLISAIKYSWNKFTFNFGIDGKLYSAQNYNELSNLLGGDYAVWSNDVNSDPFRLLMLGDKVDFNADSFTRNFGSFVQTEYHYNNLTAYINFAISKTGYNRIDYFNYMKNDSRRETGWKYFTSTTIKTGLNYNINKYNNIFVNLGNFSRAPLSMNVYDYSNNLYENVKNEKISSFEFGYGFKNDIFKFNINYFLTEWDDKAFSQSYLNSDSTAIYYYNLFGASANHTGIEFDGRIIFANNLSAGAMFSYSSNKWTSDVDAFVRPESNPSDEIRYRAYTKDLYVGNYPMTSASFELLFEESLNSNVNIFLNPIFNFYGRYYAEFNPEARTDIDDRNSQAWKLPDFYNLDLHIGFDIQSKFLFLKSLNMSLNIYNLLNDEYIIEAFDGVNHDSQSAHVWYGRERWWSASVSVTL